MGARGGSTGLMEGRRVDAAGGWMEIHLGRGIKFIIDSD